LYCPELITTKDEFYQLTTEKEIAKDIQKKNNKVTKEIKKKFYKRQNFSINEFFL